MLDDLMLAPQDEEEMDDFPGYDDKDDKGSKLDDYGEVEEEEDDDEEEVNVVVAVPAPPGSAEAGLF